MARVNLSQDDLDFIDYALKNSSENILPQTEENLTEEEQAFAIKAQKGSKPPKYVSKGRSIFNAPVKGFYKTAGRALGALPSGGVPYEQTLEEILPTREGILEGSLERGAQIAAGGARGLGGVLKSLLGGFLGESVSEAPFIPEKVKPYLEPIAEIFAFGIPGLGKKVLPTKSQAPLVEGARDVGLTEKQLTPLIQGEKKVETLAKTAGKRFRTQKALRESKTALDDIVERFQSHPDINKQYSSNTSDLILGKIQDRMNKVLNSAERGLVKEDFQVLINSSRQPKDFLKFLRDTNKVISKNPDARKSLNLIKDDVIYGIERISPSLGKDVKLTNKLYSKYFNIYDKLKPNWQKDILDIGKHVVIGTLFGHYPALAEVLGTEAAKNLSREMLINPRFQNLSRQMVLALNSNKQTVAARIWDNLTKLVGKYSKKGALEMEKVDWKSIAPSSEEKGNSKS